ncbi:MAG: ferredoxin--NADP reductase [Bacteroidetes bacterium]|nr:MAG: ferredoxin--NADP reductase [Bacteroidota bacterium]
MSSLFHPIRIKEIIRETADASTVVFEIPEHLKSQFQYQAGQYLTVSLQVAGQEERRAYSFSSSPFTDANPAITVKKVDGGAVSPIMNDQLRAGDVIQLMPPMGKFTASIDPSNRKQYVLFGGGSGITPVMSILKSVLSQEPNSKVILIYSNRDEASIIFKSKIEGLQTQYADRLTVFHALDNAPAGFNGHNGRMMAADYARVSAELETAGFPTEYYICGPGGMMEQVKEGMKQRGIADHLVHNEYFSTPISSKPATQTIVAPVMDEEEDEFGPNKATIFFNGDEFNIEIPDGVSILEAAKDQDVDPPYACQMGVCTTCRAKVLEGSAIMDEREGLSDAEIAEGYILTCQAHPTSKKIKLIYE